MASAACPERRKANGWDKPQPQIISGISNREFIHQYAAPCRVGLAGGADVISRLIGFAQRHLDEARQSSLWSHALLFQGMRMDGHHWVFESDLEIHRKNIRPIEHPEARLTRSAARGEYKAGKQTVTFPKGRGRYDGDFEDLAKVILGEKSLQKSVRQTLLSAGLVAQTGVSASRLRGSSAPRAHSRRGREFSASPSHPRR